MCRSAARILILVTLVAFGACKDSTSPPVPTTLTISASSTTLEALGATVQLTSQVLDKKGKVMTGVPITWSSSNQAVGSVSSSGLVTAVGQGSVSITAIADAAQGSVNISVTQKPASLEKARGDAQEGTVGEALSQEPTVRVLDARSNPIPGASVAFSVEEGGGSVSTGSVASSSVGEAAVSWTLGTDASLAQKLTVSIGGVSTEFSATAAPGPKAELTVEAGDSQTGEALQALDTKLVVGVTDQYGNPISGVEVQWSTGNGSGSVVPTSGTTGAGGQAETTWTLGPLVGTQVATAAVEGLESGSLSATATAPPISEISISPADPFLEVGGTTQLTATALTAEAIELLGIVFSWISSDPTTVSVDQNGLVTGIQAGTATISAGYGGTVGSATVTVTGAGQPTGVRIEIPDSATAGQTVQAELILNTAGVPHAVGAVDITLEWDMSVLTLGDWSEFDDTYWWTGLRWSTTGRLRVVVSVPAGLTGEVTILKFPFQVTGSSGSETDISLSVERAISALTFLEIATTLPGHGIRIEVR
jgi:uncharacterized protein YjdB